MAAQDQALRTTAIKVKIVTQPGEVKCRMCKDREETVGHISSVANWHKWNIKRDTKVTVAVHWSLCEKNDIQHSKQGYQHRAEPVIHRSILCMRDWTQTTRHYSHRQGQKDSAPDRYRRSRGCQSGWEGTGKDSIEEYQDLAIGLRRLLTVKTKVIPIVVGALSTVHKGLKKNPKKAGTTISVELLQKTALLGTAHILRKH